MSNAMMVRTEVAAGGKTYVGERSPSSDGLLSFPAVAVAAGKAGTAGLAGLMTLGSSHGITDAMKVSVKWASGFRYGCAVSSYDGTTITVNGATGTGDTLPTSGAVVVSPALEIDAIFDGDAAVMLMANTSVDCMVCFDEDAYSTKLAAPVTGGSLGYLWDDGSSVTNPLASSAIAAVHVYNKTATAGTADVVIAYDNI